MGNDDEEGPRPRVEEPNRKRGEIRFEIPEDTWPPTHPARVLWNVRGTLDLGTFLTGAKPGFLGCAVPTRSPAAALPRRRASAIVADA